MRVQVGGTANSKVSRVGDCGSGEGPVPEEVGRTRGQAVDSWGHSAGPRASEVMVRGWNLIHSIGRSHGRVLSRKRS